MRYRQGESTQRVGARREVILSAGCIGSPQLLKLSGVGPPEELREHGIGVVHALPGVGENLQDHLEFYFQVACREPITLYSSLGKLSRLRIGVRWLLRHDGLGASNHFETGAFIRSRAGIRYPNLQYHFLPMAVSYDGSSLAQEHGFQAHIGPMRSQSRGWVRLRSPRVEDHPRIFFNYMSQPEDWEEMRACVRLTREFFAQPAFDRYRGREMQPGAAVQTDEQIDEFIRQKVETAYHPSCSCRMGAADDPGAVVDPQGRVIGIERLARRGFIDHAVDHHRQSQRADHHAGREDGRPHPRPDAAGAVAGAVFRRADDWQTPPALTAHRPLRLQPRRSGR